MHNTFLRGPVNTHSLEGTDLILRSLLRDVNCGTYLDVGANHPTYINNTFIFYEQGWRGFAVDASNRHVSAWARFRPRDTFINAIVSDNVREVEFVEFPDDAMSTIESETIERYSKRFDTDKVSIVHGSTTTLELICKSYEIREVHLLSIDIEGEELNALRGANLSTLQPGVISCEVKNLSLYNFKDNAICRYLDYFGYKFVAKTPLDAIFVLASKPYLNWIPSTLI